MSHPEELFLDAILGALGHAPARIVGDGKIHRFSTGKSKRDDAGWYVFHLAIFPLASSATIAPVRNRLGTSTMAGSSQRPIARASRAARHASAAREARVLWEKASPASLHHPYLVEKGIEPHGVRENSDGQLLVQVWIDGKVTSLETIAADGGKLFLTGGCVSGGSYLIAEPGDKIAVAEGFATAAPGWPSR